MCGGFWGERKVKPGEWGQLASNGREALAILASGEEVDVVATDQIMAEMDGIEIIERIKTEACGAPW